MPCPVATSVAHSAIRTDEQAPGPRVVPPAKLLPPPADALHGEFGRLMILASWVAWDTWRFWTVPEGQILVPATHLAYVVSPTVQRWDDERPTAGWWRDHVSMIKPQA